MQTKYTNFYLTDKGVLDNDGETYDTKADAIRNAATYVSNEIRWKYLYSVKFTEAGVVQIDLSEQVQVVAAQEHFFRGPISRNPDVDNEREFDRAMDAAAARIPNLPSVPAIDMMAKYLRKGA